MTRFLESIPPRRQAFTLVELLAALAIVAVLSAIAVSTLANVEAQARVERTKTLIARLDLSIGDRFNQYRTRTVPVKPPAGSSPNQAAQLRLAALRELMRIELPDRQGDLDYGVSPNIRVKYLNAVPSIGRAYRTRVESLKTSTGKEWTQPHEGAECLYLIVSMMKDGDKRLIDSLTSREIGNIDDDAVPELHDAWGNPITFLRWAPGYVNDAAVSEQRVITTQSSNADEQPDPFDPLRVDTRWQNPTAQKPFALRPLIWSRGPDRENAITMYDYNPSDPDTMLQFYRYDTDNDPYAQLPTCSRYPGQPFESLQGYQDNITNHYLEVR